MCVAGPTRAPPPPVVDFFGGPREITWHDGSPAMTTRAQQLHARPLVLGQGEPEAAMKNKISEVQGTVNSSSSESAKISMMEKIPPCKCKHTLFRFFWLFVYECSMLNA